MYEASQQYTIWICIRIIATGDLKNFGKNLRFICPDMLYFKTSAVCLEQGHPSGNVLRLARNLGVPPDLVDQFQQILNDLTAVASKEKSVKDGEFEILLKIIKLTGDKIWSLLEQFRDPEIHATVRRKISALRTDEAYLDDGKKADFQQWIAIFPFMISLRSDATPVQLVPHMIWAAQARWKYSERIELLFCSEEEEMPLWIKHIYKLARYHSATKAMVKLATRQPDIFTSIHVKAVEIPGQQRFSLGNDITALSTTLQRLTKTDSGSLVERLGQTWLTDDPEARFRKACRLNLTVHAEMQLLTFYDHHPYLTPRLLFMGTSKKVCFLCHNFLSRHPLAIGVSASHQKLYPTWMPAPCSSSVRKKHKTLLWDLNRHLEETVLRDLETRFGVRRPVHMDSTAGPSLTTTGTFSSFSSAMELPIRSELVEDQGPSSDAGIITE
ncbi:hypothetical protein PoMZ_13573 [Pyricularia oryzae]|uniref:Uncharacterized protein n=1 Tax=Pyricularia oryzae TaxID=318829 RepID=A0A4P7NVQ0_PYROR|nr:hypothetical protein PoMZ_13573 [Pyricularia oryzae]